MIIGELLMQKLIVILNKIDLIEEKKREETIHFNKEFFLSFLNVKKRTDNLRKAFSKTIFG